MGETYSTNRRKDIFIQSLIGRLRRKDQMENHKWEDNIKICFVDKVGGCGLDSSGSG
jgi:hypothetical protein